MCCVVGVNKRSCLVGEVTENLLAVWGLFIGGVKGLNVSNGSIIKNIFS